MTEKKAPYRLMLRRTRVVATIGTTSESSGILTALIEAGVNIARLNFSHGTKESHGKVIDRIREISAAMGKPVGILGDLSGPKIRVGKFEGGSIRLESGQKVLIDTTPGLIGRPGLIPSQLVSLMQDIRPGQTILLDDGLLELRVDRILNDHTAECQVLRGGLLKDHKGMNIPGAALSVPALTEKDHQDLEFAVKNRLEYVALSFVRKVEEIRELKRKILDLSGGSRARTAVIAKIEKPEALEEIESIVEESDGIMIARGDLGVELPPERVPIVQNDLIRFANERNKPVIVATQMLESMIENPRPTRAEVSDVAGAVLAGADAVMLSGETATGKFPVEAVQYMDRIIRELETYQWSRGYFGRLESHISRLPLPNAIARACTLLSQDMEIRAINVLTRLGGMPRVLSTARPNCPILAYCNDEMVVRQMQLYWGVYPVKIQEQLTLETFALVANEQVKKSKLASAGQHILLVSSPLKASDERNLNSIIVYAVH